MRRSDRFELVLMAGLAVARSLAMANLALALGRLLHTLLRRFF
jgi:hypothetical protein